MEQNDFIAAMQQSAPETKDAMVENNKSGAEKTANGMAALTLWFGCIVFVVSIILTIIFASDNNSIAAWCAFGIGLVIFIINLITWCFIKMFANMSYRLTCIDNKLDNK